MIVAIVGSRDCGDLTVEHILKHIPEACSRIVSGGANGVDRLAEQCAGRIHVPLRKIPPNYAVYGKKAPLVRNAEIVKSADLVLAFWDFSSKGTAHTIATCIEQGVECRIIDISGAHNAE